MPTTILTATAIEKITAAFGTDAAVEITHVALGDGNGGTYEPSADQSALMREFARREIELRHVLEPNAWRIRVEFGLDTPHMDVREIGFFDKDGDLIAVWAGVDVVPRKVGVVTYVLSHEISFSEVSDGLIVVTAPDDEVFDLAVATAHSLAETHLRQLRVMDAIRDNHGPF